MILNLNVTDVFTQNDQSKDRIVVNRGGTRSSKTISLLQLWIKRSFEREKHDILVTRKELPALKLSALRDFVDLLNNTPTENGYLIDHFEPKLSSPIHYENKQTKSKIYFVGSKEQQKVRGVKWGTIHINEANEIPFEVLKQFLFRTEAQIYLDFNPSDDQIWINTELEQKRAVIDRDVTVIKSSYLDNPFLPLELVKEIERLRDQDPNYWYIFGLGEYGNITNTVYRNKEKITPQQFEKIPNYNQFFGVDWGDVHPMAAMHFKYFNEKVYGREIYYKKYMQDDLSDLASELKRAGARPSDPIYCDTALPSNIRALKKLNLKAVKADKSRDDGIAFVKRMKVFITDNSLNYWKENAKYKYLEDINGNPTGQIIKFDDDLMDAERYGIFTHLKRERKGIK